jgi:uncharacterized protein (TIGR02118 family)
VIKVAGFIRFSRAMDKAEAHRYWTEEHGAMVARIPGLLRYVQNHMREAMPIGGDNQPELPFDGYMSQWYPDWSSLLKAQNSAEWAAVVADGGTFIEDGMMGPVDERVLLDGPHSPYKTVGIAYFAPNKTKKEAGDYWTAGHGPLTLKATGFTRYVQNHTIGSSDWNLSLDGFSEHWYPDRETYLESLATPEWVALGDDGPNFIDRDRFWGAAVEEVVVKG